MTELADRAVLITGASGGLGTAVTRTFLDAGAKVAAIAQTAPSPDVFAITADLTSAADAARAVAAAKQHLECIDVLVHLVGGFAGGTPVAQTSDAIWTRMLDLNLNTAFHTIRAVLPLMIEAGRGRILAIGSRTAVEPAATLSAYGVSKAALVALVRTVALELRNTNVTANIVLPSVIDTPANRAADPKADTSKWVQPDAISRLLLWLASDEAADINGAVIPIYGKA